ncbi:hypothetical protein M2337_000275 [Sphingobium sp. B2D3A]|uniref:TonB-dependent receptor n=1 Tax=unclassified Sphingobium TaxID=2611147 RepID=UPI0022259A35|nr:MULTISPECIES: TonB-dependent receptor [unclassified Sphingobium]MCW2336042.1 hypothetical protein [Sphingobium sp. B2D3A]MCW2385801.1 hypothetical protein [Sphingobium sp. B2D3D]
MERLTKPGIYSDGGGLYLCPLLPRPALSEYDRYRRAGLVLELPLRLPGRRRAESGASDRNAIVMFRAGANPDLKTQKADTFTFGLDLTTAFIPNVMIRTGYYRIKIAGRVVTPSQDDSVSLPELQGFNIRNPTRAQIENIIKNPAVFRWFTADIPFIADGGTEIYSSANQIPQGLLSQVQAVAEIGPQNFAVEKTDGIDPDLSYRTLLLGGDASVHLTGQYILNLALDAGAGSAVSRLDGYAQPAALQLNRTFIWGRDGVSVGSVVNYVDGLTDNRPGQTPRKVATYTTASLFVGFDLGRLTSTPALDQSEMQLLIANLFNNRPPNIADSVLGYDPYNNSPNPRTIGLVLTKQCDSFQPCRSIAVAAMNGSFQGAVSSGMSAMLAKFPVRRQRQALQPKL